MGCRCIFSGYANLIRRGYRCYVDGGAHGEMGAAGSSWLSQIVAPGTHPAVSRSVRYSGEMA